MLVVLDTNVVVSELMSETGKPGRIIDLALENRFQVAYDDRILYEYEDVLARPELRIRPARIDSQYVLYIEIASDFQVIFLSTSKSAKTGFVITPTTSEVVTFGFEILPCRVNPNQSSQDECFSLWFQYFLLTGSQCSFHKFHKAFC
jgi:putative PIN family toxin of toxin-antitoxin system